MRVRVRRWCQRLGQPIAGEVTMRTQTSGAVLVSRGALVPKQMEQRQKQHQQLRR
jgi:hypothetical protein